MDQLVEDLARTNFREMGSAIGNHRLDGLAPSDRSGQLFDQVAFDLLSRNYGPCNNVLVDGAVRIVECRLFDRFFPALPGRRP